MVDVESVGSMDARATGVVALGGLGYACLTFVWFSLPAYLSTVIAALGLSGVEAGVLAGAIPLTYVPLSLFSGLLVDRIGPWRAIGAGLGLVGGAQVLRGLAGGYPALLAATVLVGVGGTGITFGLPKLVSVLFPPDRTGTMSTVYLLGSYLGTAGAFGVGRPTLGPLLGGWRPLFRWSGLAVACVAVVWAVAAWAYTSGADGAGVEGAGAGVEGAGAGVEGAGAGVEGAGAGVDGTSGGAPAGEPATDEAAGRSLRADLRLVAGHGQLRLLVVVGTMYLLVLHGLQGWLPAVLEARGLAPSVAGAVTTALVVGQVTGTLSVPPLSDRFGRRRAALVGSGCLAALGVGGVLAGGTTVPVLALVVAMVGVGLGGVSPLVRALPTEMEGIGAALTGTAVGLVFAVGEVGGFLGPFLVGALEERLGSFAPGLALLAAGGLVIALAGAAMTGVD